MKRCALRLHACRTKEDQLRMVQVSPTIQIFKENTSSDDNVVEAHAMALNRTDTLLSNH